MAGTIANNSSNLIVVEFFLKKKLYDINNEIQSNTLHDSSWLSTFWYINHSIQVLSCVSFIKYNVYIWVIYEMVIKACCIVLWKMRANEILRIKYIMWVPKTRKCPGQFFLMFNLCKRKTIEFKPEGN